MQNLVHTVDTPMLSIEGTGKMFPIRRIFCVGRNYAKHVVEMGHDPTVEPPFFFTKPADALVTGPEAEFPRGARELHHEIELVVAIGKGCHHVAEESALEHVFGYAVGLDMTRRDLQFAAKQKGLPWDMAKAFDQSAPCSELKTVASIGHPSQGRIQLWVNGELKQDGNLEQQIWPVARIIARLSCYVELRPGDLIMTGTPDGVGSVRPNDLLSGKIEGVGSLEITFR